MGLRSVCVASAHFLPSTVHFSEGDVGVAFNDWKNDTHTHTHTHTYTHTHVCTCAPHSRLTHRGLGPEQLKWGNQLSYTPPPPNLCLFVTSLCCFWQLLGGLVRGGTPCVRSGVAGGLVAFDVGPSPYPGVCHSNCQRYTWVWVWVGVGGVGVWVWGVWVWVGVWVCGCVLHGAPLVPSPQCYLKNTI